MAKLGEFIKQIRGVSYKPEDVYDELTDESVALLRANNIKDGRLNFQDIIYVRKGCVKENQYLRFGDILVCTSSGSKDLVGKATFVDHDLPMTFGAFCKVVRTTSGVPQYFGHFFDSPYYRRKISDASAGANINNIRNEHIDEIEIQLPSLDAQQQIISVLNKTNYLISLRKQQLDKLDELVRARFVEMFGDLLSNTMHWTFKPLAELCDVRDGTHDSPKYHINGYPLLTSKNFTNGFVDFKNASLISKEDFEAINQRSKVDYGDIVMPMIGTIGHPVIIDTDQPFAIKNVALIKFLDNGISNIFIREILDSNYFKAVIQEKNRGNTQKFIALGDIRKIMIPLVPSEVQSKFSDFANAINQQRLTIRQGLDKLETLKKALMQQYFG